MTAAAAVGHPHETSYDWFRSIFGLVGQWNEFLPYGLPGGTGDGPWTFVMSTRYKYR